MTQLANIYISYHQDYIALLSPYSKVGITVSYVTVWI